MGGVVGPVTSRKLKTILQNLRGMWRISVRVFAVQSNHIRKNHSRERSQLIVADELVFTTLFIAQPGPSAHVAV